MKGIKHPPHFSAYFSGASKNAWLLVLVAALGYFVDIYDLILFSVVRVKSLRSLWLDEQSLLPAGVMLLNLQMIGMLLGGVFFGVLGDRLGRLSVLFGSILLYSVANFANGFVNDITWYGVLRFIAGFGLAGELGAGITLVSETLPKHLRGIGTTVVATVGVSGALLAWFVASHFDWRNAYIVGGAMGMALLFLRIGVVESELFTGLSSKAVSRGNFFHLFSSWSRVRRFVGCVLVGMPIWYTVGILVTLSPEFSKELGVSGVIDGGSAVFYCYGGLILGKNQNDGSTALIRVEQLYPFPAEQIAQAVKAYPNLKQIIWAQEEPKNMGAYTFVAPRLQEIFMDLAGKGVSFRYVGRTDRASPAAGSPKVHALEQAEIIKGCFK